MPEAPVVDVCVVGGSGFIGTSLVRRLAAQHSRSVRIVDKNPSPYFNEIVHTADVRFPEQLRQALPCARIIVNLAAEHRDDVRPRSLYYDVNVEGARNICAVAREQGTQSIVFTSSVAVYGFAELEATEEHPISPFNEYGKTKYLAEEVYREWQREDPDNRSLCIIRPTVVFGERNRGNVYNLLRQIATRKFVMVGSGRNRKSVAYVENVSALIEAMLDAPPGVRVFNYADKPDFSMNELVSLVRRLMGENEKGLLRVPFFLAFIGGGVLDLVARVSGRRFAVSAIRVRKFCANSVYASRVIDEGFAPPFSIEEAIARTVRHEFGLGRESDGVIFESE